MMVALLTAKAFGVIAFTFFISACSVVSCGFGGCNAAANDNAHHSGVYDDLEAIGLSHASSNAKAGKAKIKAGKANIKAGKARVKASNVKIKASKANIETGRANIEASKANIKASNAVAPLQILPTQTDSSPNADLNPAKTHCLAANNPNFLYRKRVAVLPMVLQQRQDAVDIPYVEREYSQALVRRLNTAEHLIAVDATAYHALSRHSLNSRLHSPISPDLIRRAAKDLNVQFIVMGRLLDLSLDRTQTHAPDLVTSLKGWKNLGRQTYQKMTGSYWRQMHIDITVFDGASGALLKNQQYSGAANYIMNAHRGYAAGRSGYGGVGLDGLRFWQSDYGELLAHTLNEQAALIHRTLECLALRATVLRVDGDLFEIDAGAQAQLMPGHRMPIFYKKPVGLGRQGVPMHRWQKYGEVTVEEVFALKAIVRLDKNLPPDVIRVGDIVQAW